VTITPLRDLVTQCRADRQSFRADGTRVTYACVEIFRRACLVDEEASAAIWEIFAPQVERWANPRTDLPPEDVADLVQETFLHFFVELRQEKYHYLVETDDLGLLMAFLKRRVKWECLTSARKRSHLPFALDPDLPLVDARAEMQIRAVENQDECRRLLAHIKSITSDLEWLVFSTRILLNMPPRDILAAYPERFTDMQQLRAIIQRLTRRIDSDEVIQSIGERVTPQRKKTAARAFLEIRDDQSGGQSDMDEPCILDESLLLDYISGVATVAEQALVERTPACLAAAQRLGQRLLPLIGVLHRFECPDVETLIGYQELRLDSTAQLVVRQHVAACPNCRAELLALADIDAVPDLPAKSVFRRIVEALFQPPLAMPQPVRGDVRHYRTPQVSIQVSVRKMQGKARSWTLRGQLRLTDDHPIQDLLEAVLLTLADQPDDLPLTGALEPNGGFVVRNLPAGTYCVRLLTREEEIVIRRIVVGDSAEE